jgi:hypothetical protein
LTIENGQSISSGTAYNVKVFAVPSDTDKYAAAETSTEQSVTAADPAALTAVDVDATPTITKDGTKWKISGNITDSANTLVAQLVDGYTIKVYDSMGSTLIATAETSDKDFSSGLDLTLEDQQEIAASTTYKVKVVVKAKSDCVIYTDSAESTGVDVTTDAES